MSKTRFILLNVLAVVLSFLLVTRMLLLRNNELIHQELQRVQMDVGDGQSAWQLLQRLALRVDQGARNEPDLKDLLKQHQLNVQNPPETNKQ